MLRLSEIKDHLIIKPEHQILHLKNQVDFRNRFFRMVIHDLRGPATSIKLGSDMALQSVKKILRSNFKQAAHGMGVSN